MKITDNNHIDIVCKLGRSTKCCRYLVAGVEGIECMKSYPAQKAIIDRAWAKNEHVAQGDNCEGWEVTALQEPGNG